MAVRREKVLLEVESNLAATLARDAAMAKLLGRTLDDLGRVSKQAGSSVGSAKRPLDDLDRSARKADQSINQLTGRLAVYRDAAAALGPGIVPMVTAGVGAVTGLTNQLGFATLAMGTTVIAFQGFGETVEAVNAAALEPTQANLDKARAAMERLSPAAQSAAREVARMMPTLDRLQSAAAEGMMPGFERSIASLATMAPRVESLLREVGSVVGEVMGNVGESFASDRWAEFIGFLETNARPTLLALADTVGSVAHGFAELWMAFQPVNDSFADGMLRAAQSFDAWASSVGQTEGFREFLAYIQDTGPQVVDALAAFGNALVQIGVAAAPLGGPVLTALEAVADVVSAIAESEIGTPLVVAAAAMATLSRATRLWGAITGTAAAQAVAGQVGYGGALRSNIALAMRFGAMTRAEVAEQKTAAAAVKRTALQSAAAIGGVAAVSSGAADAIGLQNTATLALAGSMAGPWGAAAGAVVGLTMDMASGTSDLNDEFARLRVAFGGASSSDLPALRDQLEAARQKVADYKAELESASLFNPSNAAGMNAVEDLFGRSQLEELEADLAATERAAAEAQDRFSLVGASSAQMAQALDQAANRTSGMTDKMIGARNAARETARGFITLGDSVDDAKVSLSGWLKQLEQQRQALINFRRNAQEAAEKGLDQGLIRALREAGPEGALRMRQLANASEQQIGRANAAWRGGQCEVRRYTNEVGGVPKSAKTTVTADTGNAHRAIGGVRGDLASIDGDVATVRVQVITDQITNVIRNVFPGFRNSADGGTVPKDGGPYGDRYPYLLAPGEEVISNRRGQADRYRSLLKQINNAADGATVGGDRTRPAGPRTPVEREADRAARALEGFKRRLESAEKALARHEKTVAREQKQRDAVLDRWQNVRDSTRSGLAVDPWAVPDQGNVWATNRAVGMDPLAILRNSIRENRDAKRDIAALRRKGLNGAALTSAAADPDRLDFLLSQGSGFIRQYEQLYNQQIQTERDAGTAAANAVEGRNLRIANRELASANRELRSLRQDVRQLERTVERSSKENARDVAKGVNGAASKGKRDQAK